MKNTKYLYVSPACETVGFQLEILANGSAESINWGGDYYSSSLDIDPLAKPEKPGIA